MRKWTTIMAIVLCFCLCLSPIVHAEEEMPTETPELTDYIIDFDFCFTVVDEDLYAQLETTYPRTELSLLIFKYYDFNGEEQDGQIIVNRHLEYDAIDAFQDLYEANLTLEDISLFSCDGFDINFMSPPQDIVPDDDPYNLIFGHYGFDWNDNQTRGARCYTLEFKAAEWYP